MELNARDTDVASIFDEGLQAHNAGDLSAAEQLYQETLSIQPNHSEANHNIKMQDLYQKVSLGRCSENVVSRARHSLAVNLMTSGCRCVFLR